MEVDTNDMDNSNYTLESNLKNTNNEKKRKREETKESKQIAEEKYIQDLQEQQYKRLMHLLNRSKFYSSYIVDKINNGLAKETNAKTSEEDNKENYNDGNMPSRLKGNKQVNKVKNHISKNVQEKIHNETSKLDLNEEEMLKDSEIKAKPIDNIETPRYFNGELRDYQKRGFQWLRVLYENGINGILGDEMGLGKTIQAIALLCHLIEKQQDGPYLLVVPLSTVPNWLIEFERFAPKLPVVLFHGPISERLAARREIKKKYPITLSFSTFPIVLTTFEVPLVEQHFLRSFNWRYIIVDEGQKIKNHQCKLVKVLKSFKSMNRLLMTGTPLQNNLAELWSLLNFLLPEIFDDLAVFESWFDAKHFERNEGTKKFLKLEAEKQVLSTLREILKPFMLRREKSEVCADVPPKKEIVIYAPLTELQHGLYKAVVTRDIDKLTKIESEKLQMLTSDGQRPKRKCVLNKSVDSIMKSAVANSLLAETNKSMNSNKGKYTKSTKMREEEQNLLQWKQYTDVTERNRDFLINIQVGSWTLYKKILNHPYMIHCPLGHDGLPKIDEQLVKASGKLLVLDTLLAKLKQRGHKVLLYSTWTQILDMIEDYLSLRDYKYVRLDGQTKLEARKEHVKQFNTDPETFLFLLSTRAGGVGLNLMGADTVIIYDPDWNPQADIQAMARCHRIGQTRPVVIYKLCAKGTIDEIIYNRAEAKRVLEKVVISTNMKKLSINNKSDLLALQRLLESKECQVIASENEVLTDEELNKLLDRSDMYIKQES
ncbi:lymphoid-specific helicase-like [Ceratina calcarata]|uniref:Lymphoid-specific helicase-like n=1 Tax=Ceratina calcarata TaxID=156304 RepID=A0AAJ7IYS6_9HYME|nr:lymphoid-specific helicase-like [Ceratina calcarata]